MANPFGVPGISVEELAARQKAGEAPLLLDVREPFELELASFGEGVVAVPLSELAARGLAALPDALAGRKEDEIIVVCHHGNRSAQVTAWLRQNGFAGAVNLDGGIDAYARRIDPSVGQY